MLIASCGGEPSVPATPDPVGNAALDARPGPDLIAAEGLEALRPRVRLGWPTESVHITSYFGWRTDPVSGRGTRLHKGLDLRGAVGDPVLSIADGTVSFVGHDPLLGNLVIIDHGRGVESLYGHMHDVLVQSELPVVRGAAIGLVGNTGRSEAPHLHLTVRVDGVAIDPLAVLGRPLHAPTALVAGLEESDEGSSETGSLP